MENRRIIRRPETEPFSDILFLKIPWRRLPVGDLVQDGIFNPLNDPSHTVYAAGTDVSVMPERTLKRKKKISDLSGV